LTKVILINKNFYFAVFEIELLKYNRNIEINEIDVFINLIIIENT